MIKFRLANENDVNAINHIYDKSKMYFKASGIDQWQNNYPNIDTIISDIEKRQFYVMECDDRIVGGSMLGLEHDKSYESIFDGSWDLSIDYGVIHRIAVDQDEMGKGYGKALMLFLESEAFKSVDTLRIDTHPDNQRMLKLLDSLGYHYCGKIIAKDGVRVAFEKKAHVSDDEV